MSFDTTNAAPPVTTADTSADTQTPVDATTQPPATPEPAKPNPEDQFASKFSALSKREREIRNKETALKERVAKLEAYEKATSTWKDDPAAILDYLQENFGLSFDSIADAQIGKFQKTLPKSPEEQMKAELEAIKKSIKDKEDAEAAKLKAQQEEQEKIEKENVAKYEARLVNDITSHVKENMEAFELINVYNMQEAVLDTIRANYEEIGELMDIPTACQAVETYLEQQLAKTPKAAKLRKLFAEDKTQQVEQDQTQLFGQHQVDEPSTLSVNRMQSSNRPAPKTQTADPLDRDARIKAILARNGN